MNRAYSKTNLTNAVREHMIQHGYAETALLIDIMLSVHCTIGQRYSVAEIMQLTAHAGLSEKVIRNALRCPVFFRSSKPTAGRRCNMYTLPSPRQVRDWFMVFDLTETSDNLPLEAYRSVSAYRQHLHIAMVVRLAFVNGGTFKMSRVKMAKRLAVTVVTLRNYERDSGVVVKTVIRAVDISHGFANLPSRHNGSRGEWLCIITPDGNHRNYPLVAAIAANAIKSGCQVFRMRQDLNEYQYSGDSTVYLPAGMRESYYRQRTV